MVLWLFDRNGQAQLFLYDDGRFISRDGRNLGWLFGTVVTNLGGVQVGWFENGVLYDRDGAVLAFSQNASGSFSRPSLGGTPSFSLPSNPGKPNLKSTISSGRSSNWSHRSLWSVFG
ncbi:hypothetical protein HYT84_01105 [Candidatus Micrarchaeota archaeon]|nr:hypothetical protein [Candidatus Micrarchaeota archaeon]